MGGILVMIKKMGTFLFLLPLLWSILMFSPPVNASEAHFIYPVDKAVVSVSRVRVIGKKGSSGEHSLKVENSSGESNYAVSEVENLFAQDIRLAEGKNTISLLSDTGVSETLEIFFALEEADPSYPEEYIPYYLHSEGDLTGECTQCHTANKDNILQFEYVEQKTACATGECHSTLKKDKFLHGPLREEGSCVKCHNPHGSENSYFVQYFGGDLCFSCHQDAESMIWKAKYVHFPVKKRECTACHDPHGSDLEFHLKRGSIAGLCEGCHGEDQTSHKVLHTPLKNGDCIACHSPHVSENKALLLDSGKDLCFRCHKVRQEEYNSKYVHEPVSKNCTICHDPHGSATIYHLRSKKDEEGNYISTDRPYKELCLSCHNKLDPEIVDQIKKGTVKHDPVEKGECIICHTPHSTNHKKQLRKPLKEICFSCHQKMKELITGSIHKHGPIRTNDCAQCHLPHGSQNRKLLRSKFSEKYADSFNMDNYALCFNCHSPEIVLNKKSESTEFRNGRTNLHYLHVNRKKKGRNCKTCHDIHASDQEKHIRKKVPFERSFIITIEYTKTSTGGSCVVGCHKPRNYDRISEVTNK